MKRLINVSYIISLIALGGFVIYQLVDYFDVKERLKYRPQFGIKYDRETNVLHLFI